MLRRVGAWLPPIIYAIVIFHLSSESDPLPQVTAIVWDKALHTLEYAGFAGLLARAFRTEGCRWTTAIVLAVTLSSAYAGSDELHQLFVVGRDSDVRDWMADVFGSTCGAFAYAGIAQWARLLGLGVF